MTTSKSITNRMTIKSRAIAHQARESAKLLHLLRVTGLLLAFALFSGCGSATNPITSASTTSTVTSASTAATCNGFSTSTAGTLNGQITTYSEGGTLVESKARLRITDIMADFTTSNYHIEMFRWTADAAGNVNLDSTPLSFIIAKGQSNSTPITTTLSTLSFSDMQSIAGSNGFSATNAPGFFNQTLLIPQGLDYGWNAIKLVVYDGTTSVTSVDFLIPSFVANPNTYAQSHPAVLNSLHPFWSIRSQSQSDAAWVSQSSSYCF